MESKLRQVLISFNKKEMVDFLQTHPECFDEAMDLALTNDQPFSWRSAWLLWSCIKENDPRIKPYLKKIVKSIPDKKDGHQRELLKILLVMDLDEDNEGIVFDHAMNIWEKINKNPSVRITALKIILKTAKKYPEIRNEIPFLTQDHFLETLSPGVRNSVARLISEPDE